MPDCIQAYTLGYKNPPHDCMRLDPLVYARIQSSCENVSCSDLLRISAQRHSTSDASITPPQADSPVSTVPQAQSSATMRGCQSRITDQLVSS